MFEKLKQRWGVGGWQLILIILTFATGGSACAAAGKWVLSLLGAEKGTLGGWLLYLLLVTLLWPVCVLLISIPLGQFRFFKNYLQRVWLKITGKQKSE